MNDWNDKVAQRELREVLKRIEAVRFAVEEGAEFVLRNQPEHADKCLRLIKRMNTAFEPSFESSQDGP